MYLIVLASLLIFLSNSIYIENIISDKQIYKPGDDAILTINGVLFYNNPFSTPRSFNQAIIEISSSFYQYSFSLGNLDIQSNVPQRFSRNVVISIPKNINEGTYNVDVKLSGYLETDRDNRLLSSYGSIALKIEHQRELDIKLENNVFSDRGENYLILCVNKPIENIRIRGEYLIREYYEEVVINCSKIKFEYVIPNKTGNIDFPVQVQYQTKFNKYFYSTNFKIDVERASSNIKIEQIGTMNNNIGKLSMVLKYEGSEPIRNVKIYSKGPIQFMKPNYITINQINNGTEATIEAETFYIGNAGVITNEFLITYEENNVLKSTTILLPIKVTTDVRLDVYIETSNLTAGVQNNINLVVGNPEKYSILGVSVILNSQDAKLLSNQKFIGEILPNDYSVERFSIIPNEGENKIEIQVNYMDNAGNLYKKFYQVSLIANPPIIKPKEEISPILIILALLVIGYLIYKKWKK